MSLEAMNHVLAHSDQRGTDRLILLLVAHHANADGKAWPSYDLLAHEARLSRRHVVRIIKRLVQVGELEKGAGPRRTNIYTFPVRDPLMSSASSTGDIYRDRGDIPALPEVSQLRHSEGVAVVSPELERTETYGANNRTSRGLFAEEGSFEEFWAKYPARRGRKVGKATAAKVWSRLAERDRSDALTAVGNYAAEVGGYAKDAHRWLRDRIFEEYLGPPAPGADSSSRKHRPFEDRSPTSYHGGRL